MLIICTLQKVRKEKNHWKGEEVFREVAETFIKSVTQEPLLADFAAAVGRCARQTLPGIHPLWELAKHD